MKWVSPSYRDKNEKGKSFRTSHRSCSLKKVLLDILQIRRKTPVPESLFQWSCRSCVISKNTFSYRTPLGDCFQSLKIMSDICFKCEIFFQLIPEILFMFLNKHYKTTLISGHTASLQLSIGRLISV